MKATHLLAFLSLFLFVSSCKKEPKATINEAETVTEKVTESNYAINPESHIIWKANKIVGGHNGTFNTSSGNLQFSEGKLVGGQAIFNINSLKVTDMSVDDKDYGKLTGHLLSPDFFDVEKHPNATFDITEVSDNEIKGNLILKGISKNIAFKAAINNADDKVTITSEPFTIDRTAWDIKYNSGKFADPASLGDFLIKDDIEIEINVSASKK